jgi:DNA-binding NtrC family response regulator
MKIRISRRVLIVDDDIKTARHMELLLSRLARRVRVVHTYAAAERLLGEGRWDVVISDFHLDGAKTGGDLLALLARKNPRVRRILCTGSSRADCPHAELTLRKPFTTDDLYDAVFGPEELKERLA